MGVSCWISAEPPSLVGFCLGSGLAGVLFACEDLGKGQLARDPRKHSADTDGEGCVMT